MSYGPTYQGYGLQLAGRDASAARLAIKPPVGNRTPSRREELDALVD